MIHYLSLILPGLVAGLIDSIAGGGGLITVPTLTLLYGPGVEAIGTNKVGATLAAFGALFVYLRAGHLDLKNSLLFSAVVMMGAAIGSRVAFFLPASAFQWILMITCPLILWTIFNKNIWISREAQTLGIELSEKEIFRKRLAVILSGLVCGFYDGIWGPGGGTFMFLSLLVFAKMPLLTALAASKLSNFSSAGVGLISYSIQGKVHWEDGAAMAMGAIAGSLIGAKFATKGAARVVRPALVIVVSLLLIRLIK